MASHVVVMDATARRAQVKTTPNKPLSEILEEACTKLGLKASNYGLKNNNKQVDLSRSFRLSGLSSGAKLELVQLSKSAGVVSVALQLPPSEARDVPNGRLMDKFPSTTTLWLVLRKFEAGVAGSTGSKRNLTARGVPSTTNSGEGRLYYEQPVLQVLNRELSSLSDLQKNLSQLGLNSGSALIRLSYRTTETPLEEAMQQIQQYFDDVEAPPSTTSSQPQPTSTTEPIPAANTGDPSQPEPSAPIEPEWTSDKPADTPMTEVPTASNDTTSSADLPSPPTTSRPLSVYRPPTTTTPSAASLHHNESDYTPTIEHAQIHQRFLNNSTRNTRLPTEAELAKLAEEDAAKVAAVREVEVKIRFPDQSAVTAKFGVEDTGTGLYGFVRECLEEQFRSEGFVLRNPGIKPGLKGDSIPDDDKKLIRDLLLKGRVLVVFDWLEGASVEARGAKSVLKEGLRRVAVDVRVNDVSAGTGTEEKGIKVNVGRKEGDEEGDGKEGGGLGKKMPKWLKGLAKK